MNEEKLRPIWFSLNGSRPQEALVPQNQDIKSFIQWWQGGCCMAAHSVVQDTDGTLRLWTIWSSNPCRSPNDPDCESSRWSRTKSVTYFKTVNIFNIPNSLNIPEISTCLVLTDATLHMYFKIKFSCFKCLKKFAFRHRCWRNYEDTDRKLWRWVSKARHQASNFCVTLAHNFRFINM